MFERIASNVLVRVLGDYIEDIDEESLQIVPTFNFIQNLRTFREYGKESTALDAFDFLPVVVVHGYIGNIHASVPWSSLGSVPVVLEITDLFIVVQPKQCIEWNHKVETEREIASAKKKLGAYDFNLKVPINRSSNSQFKIEEQIKQEAKGDQGYISRLTEDIVNNIQVKIKNVHFRYEDDYDPQQTYSIGAHISSLSLESTNESWIPTFIKHMNNTILHKMAKLENACVYVTRRDQLLSKLPRDRFLQIMKTHQISNYLFTPIDGILRAKFKGTSITAPNLSAQLDFEDVSISLDHLQHKDIMSALDYLTNFRKFEPLRSKRPRCKFNTVKDRQEWWRFLIQTTSSTITKNYFTWDRVSKVGNLRREYISLYKRSKNVPWLQPLDDYERDKMIVLQEKNDPDLIILFRQFADEELSSETKQHGKSVGWYDWFMGRSETTNQVERPSSTTTNTLVENQSLEKFIFGIHLRGGTISIKTHESNHDIIQANYTHLSSQVQIMRDDSLQVQLKLTTLTATDMCTKKSEFKNILYTCSNDNHVDLITARVNYNNKSMLVRLDVAQTIVVVSAPLIQNIISFFTIRSSSNYIVKKPPIDKRLVQSNIVQSNHDRLLHALDTKKQYDVLISLHAPLFIVPMDICNADSSLLLVDLGHLSLESIIDSSRNQRIKNSSLIESDYYDKYLLNLQGLKLSHKNSKLESNILDNVDVHVNVDHCVVQDIDSKCPLVLQAHIPRIQVNISTDVISSSIKIMNNVLELLHNPTGKNNVRCLFSSQVQIKAGHAMLKNDAKDSNHWYVLELHDTGQLYLYESKFAKRVPLVMIECSDPVASSSDLFTITVNFKQQPTQFVFFTKHAKQWCSTIRSRLVNNKSLIDKESTDQINKRRIKLVLTLSELDVELIRSYKDPIQVQFQQLSASMVMSKFDTETRIGLKNILVQESVTEYMIKSKDVSHTLIGFQMNQHLVNSTKERSADVEVQANLHQLEINLNPIFIQELVEYYYDLRQVIDTSSQRTLRYSSVVDQKEVIKSSNFDLLNASINLNQLQVLLLTKHQNPFASIQLQGAQISFVKHQRGQLISGHLNDARIEHLVEDTLYKEVIGIVNSESHSIAKFKYHSHFESECGNYGSLLELTMESPRIVYIASTIDSFKKYYSNHYHFNKNNNGDGVARVSVASPPTPTPITPTIKKPLLFNIKLIEPVLVIPNYCSNPDYAFLTIKSVHVNNKMVTKDDCSYSVINVKCNRTDLKSMISSRISPVVQSVDINIVVNIPKECTDPYIPDYHVLVESDTIFDGKLTHAQYQQVFQIVFKNIRDQSLVDPNQINIPRVDLIGNRMVVQIKVPTPIVTVADECELARVEGSDLMITYSSSRSSLSSHVRVSLKTLNAFDLRAEIKSLFKNFISERKFDLMKHVHTTDTSNREDLVRVDVELSKNTAVRIRIGDPRIVFEPGIIKRLIDFFKSRYPEAPKPDQIAYIKPLPQGDILLTTDIYLGEDLILAKDRRIIASHDCVIDGCGHVIEFRDLSDLIHIHDGVTLKLRNVVLRYQGEIWEHVKCGISSKFVAGNNSNIVHQDLIPSHQDLTVDEEDDKTTHTQPLPVVNDPTSYILRIQCEIERSTIVFPTDTHDKHSKLLILSLGADVGYMSTSTTQSIKALVKNTELYVEHQQSSKIKVASIIEPFYGCFDSIHTINVGTKLNFVIKDGLLIRLAYGDAHMLSDMFRYFMYGPDKSNAINEQVLKMALHHDDEDEDHDNSSNENQDDDPFYNRSGNGSIQSESDDFEDATEGSSKKRSLRSQSTSPNQKQDDVVVENWDRTGQFNLKNDYDDTIIEQSTNQQEINQALSPTNTTHDDNALPTVFEFDTSTKDRISILLVDDTGGYDKPLLSLVIQDVHVVEAIKKFDRNERKCFVFHSC
ncbi:vacuolar protein sorting protein 13A [Acrasis kona]|uniref:Vacuolar protein sorting protein 13A n=1 Tax=Acrasis kona TaxID=1008807 RepID=A0AAW2YYU1_9EUKA